MKKKTVKNIIISESNHIIIICKVNSVKGRFIIDTGASNSCIDYLLVKKFNLNFIKSNEKVSSATNKINETFHSKNNTLKIGDCPINNFDFVLFDMTFINNSLKEKNIKEIDGIIGSDILNKLNAIISYKKKEIILEF